MSSIHVSNKDHRLWLREWWNLCVLAWHWEINGLKVGNRFHLPVDNTPVLGGTQILGHLLENFIVLLVRACREPSKETNSKTYVRPGNNVSIHQLTKELAV